MDTVDKIGYEAVIGLEVHAQLQTQSKMFCGCGIVFGAAPNSLTCPVCLGHPGALPVLNRRAVEYAVKMILAVGGEVRKHSIFARKNYFYPDLPKGYQISQYDSPIGLGGSIQIELPEYSRDIELIGIHLEEDAGKSIHPEGGEGETKIDLNRCGVPLLEIVTRPDIRSPQEAHRFLSKLKLIMQYLKICSGDMEKGALRCDANISLRRRGEKSFGTRTELKNLNSFRAVERALAYEIKRHAAILDAGGKVIQETLLWNDDDQKSEAMRGKEESEDYRYFPEPDLIPIKLEQSWIDEIKSDQPELPDARRERLAKEYDITSYDAGVLTGSNELADYFEAVAAQVEDTKRVANWLMVDVLREIHERKLEVGEFFITPNMLAELLCSLESDIISGKMAKEIFREMAASGKSAGAIIEEQDLRQISDSTKLTAVIEEIITQEAIQVQKYREGKRQLFDFFVGQVMKATSGKANPEMVNKLLKEKLDG